MATEAAKAYVNKQITMLEYDELVNWVDHEIKYYQNPDYPITEYTQIVLNLLLELQKEFTKGENDG